MGTAPKIAEILEELGLEAPCVDDVVEQIPADAWGLLLYGSRARGDHQPESDFDLLVLTPVPQRSARVDSVSLSFYSPEQLATATHTLYGTHLIRDGVVLWDRDGTLTRVLEQIEEAKPVELFDRVRALSVVLDVGPGLLSQHLNGFIKLARYLLRTAIYARAMEGGQACFSVRELARRFHDPSLELLLASDPALLPEPSSAEFYELTRRLAEIVGPLPANPWGSLEALVVENWDSDRVLAAVAARVMSADDSPFDYADLPKVIL